MPSTITLLTDFGTSDSYVAQMKGVMLSIAPTCNLVDVSHQVPPQDIRTGSRLLREIAPVFPKGTIHVAVIDPGVGTTRRIIAIESAEQLFVLPDNGLIDQVVRDYGYQSIYVVENPNYRLSAVSSTFHGRDIMAPAAAHLASGLSPSALGPPTRQLNSLPATPLGGSPNPDEPCVIGIDHFGNAMLDIPDEHELTGELQLWIPASSTFGSKKPERVSENADSATLDLDDVMRSQRIQVVTTYADAEAGDLVALRGSAGHWELAIVQGSAANSLGLQLGMSLRLRSSHDE